MQKTFLMAAVIVLSAAGARAQDTPASEGSASYSFLRFGVSHGVNQNGASVSVGIPFSGNTVSTVRGSFGIVFRFGR